MAEIFILEIGTVLSAEQVIVFSFCFVFWTGKRERIEEEKSFGESYQASGNGDSCDFRMAFYTLSKVFFFKFYYHSLLENKKEAMEKKEKKNSGSCRSLAIN